SHAGEIIGDDSKCERVVGQRAGVLHQRVRAGGEIEPGIDVENAVEGEVAGDDQQVVVSAANYIGRVQVVHQMSGVIEDGVAEMHRPGIFNRNRLIRIGGDVPEYAGGEERSIQEGGPAYGDVSHATQCRTRIDHDSSGVPAAVDGHRAGLHFG